MGKYKIEARENIYIKSFDLRMSSGEEYKFEKEDDDIPRELEKLKSIGSLRITKLSKETLRIEDEEDEPEEDDEVVTDDIDKYDCPECEQTHYVDSNIGKEHLEYLDKNKEDRGE